MRKRAPYAKGTEVAVETTRRQVRQELDDLGATGYKWLEDEDQGIIGLECRLDERKVRLRFVMGVPPESGFGTVIAGYRGRVARDRDQRRKAWEAEVRRRWRCLHFQVKAKVQSVLEEVATFEYAFEADVVMPDGYTAREHYSGWVWRSVEAGKVLPFPDALPAAYLPALPAEFADEDEGGKP